ncbi:hypothetical protein QBC39DRAFT_416262 [Podospora conica]|nr:hypothetical protein QBC39DRAFT_416262 [Schizothecium conicum]
MSLPESIHMSRLSLQSTPSPPKPKSPMQPLPRSPEAQDPDQYSDDDESDWEDEDDTRGLVFSPSGLRYAIGHLPRRTQRMMRALYNTQDPPRISLELCNIKQEGGDGDGFFYAFQLQEVVPCSVRIGSKNSTRFSMPKCECADARYRRLRPCKHIMWLFDQLSKQILFDHDEPDTPLTMSEMGYPDELGDPFEQVSKTRLDLLADSLRCDTAAPGSDTAPISHARLREAREMVAAVAGIPARDIDQFRLDLEETQPGNGVIHRGDLEATLFSVLIASHSLAARVRAELAPSDPAVDPFRAIQRRAARIISELDLYSSSLQDPTRRRPTQTDAEGPRNVQWAAAQIRRCVTQVERLVSRSATPLGGPARSSAARALVGILKSVAGHNVDSHGGDTVDDRNLYMCLIGNQDTGFVYLALEQLVDQSQYVEELESAMELIGRSGAPESYVSHMRGLIRRMRSHTGEESRRSSVVGPPSSETAATPRNVTPPMEGVPPPPGRRTAADTGPGEPGSSGSNVQFLTPTAPASTRARGGRGGAAPTLGPGESSRAGSKRSISGTGAESAKDPKRSR